MPTNREYLDQLASESPDKLKAWFDAEHVGDTACVTKTPELLDVDGVDSREKLEAWAHEEIAEKWAQSDREVTMIMDDLLDMLDRQAVITADANKELIEWQAATVARLQKEVDAIKAANDDYREEVDGLQRRNDELSTSYDKLKRERDNLAADLLTCNREREQLREHLGIALDHAHDICALVDIGE